MSDKSNYPEKLIASLLKGEEPATGLQNEIMNKIGALAERQKAKRAKEKMIIMIYMSVTLAALFIIILLFLYRNNSLRSPSLPPEDLSIYYILFIIASVFALLSFGIYYSRFGKMIE